MTRGNSKFFPGKMLKPFSEVGLIPGGNVSSCSFFFALFLLNKKHLADGFSTGRSHRMLRLLRQGAHVAVPALCYREPSIN
jgi:hypothetical protein